MGFVLSCYNDALYVCFVNKLWMVRMLSEMLALTATSLNLSFTRHTTALAVGVWGTDLRTADIHRLLGERGEHRTVSAVTSRAKRKVLILPKNGSVLF